MREADFQAIAEAWEDGDTEGLALAGKRVGLALSLDVLGPLDDQRFDRKTIVSMIAEALAHSAGIAVRGLAGNYSSEVCLAVKHAGHLTIAIKPVARETVSPAGAWPELKPWFKDLAKNRARAEAWASRPDEDRVRIPIQRDESRTSDLDEAALLQQIVETAHDDGARLVLADRLLEREDVRGDLIRLDLELKELAADDERRIEVVRKIEKLEEEHGKRLAGRAGEVAEAFTLAGGFVDSITIAANAFKRYGDELLSTQPIREVKIRPYNAAAIELLAKSPHLARVRCLVLAGNDRIVPLEPLHGFRFEKLEELAMISLDTQGPDGEHWFAKLDAPHLRKLRVFNGTFGLRPLFGLGANRALCETLEELDIQVFAGSRSRRPDPTLDAAFEQLVLPNLRVLRLRAWFTDDARIAALRRSAPRLTTVEVD